MDDTAVLPSPHRKSTHLLYEPDDPNRFFRTNGQGARQAVQLARQLKRRQLIRSMGHVCAGGIAKRLPGAAGRIKRIQGYAVETTAHTLEESMPERSTSQDVWLGAQNTKVFKTLSMAEGFVVCRPALVHRITSQLSTTSPSDSYSAPVWNIFFPSISSK